jgi:hypothetical protein
VKVRRSALKKNPRTRTIGNEKESGEAETMLGPPKVERRTRNVKLLDSGRGEQRWFR